VLVVKPVVQVVKPAVQPVAIKPQAPVRPPQQEAVGFDPSQE
jgi:hypothetical protein